MDKQYNEFESYVDNLKYALSPNSGIPMTGDRLRISFDRFRFLREQQIIEEKKDDR